MVILAKPKGGGGGVTGPATSTDNAVARFDGTGGDTLQDSGVTIDDSGNVNLSTHGITAADYYGNANNASLKGYNTDNSAFRFQARDNGVSVIEVARLQGAADPYFQATLPLVLKPIATASLPATPVEGMIGYDDTLNKFVVYTGAAWIPWVVATDAPAAHAASHAVGGADTVLPADPGSDKFLMWDDSETALAWGAPAGSGDVTAAANLTDNMIVRGDGGVKGVQTTGITIADTTNNVSGMGTLGCGALTTTGTTTIDTGLTGVIRADSGVLSVDTDVTDIVAAASDSAAGKSELATAAETTTGTDTGRAVTPDGLAGSDYGKRIMEVIVVDSATAVATGDGKAYIFIPSEMNGWNLVNAAAAVNTVSSSGLPSIAIYNVTQTADMLSVNITIDANAKTSYTATTPVDIDEANDDVATGNELRIDVDVAGTGTKGLAVILTFQLP